jgi:hypothetical protein
VARWQHHEILDKGFVPVPIRFLETYSKLRPAITSGEALFIVHLMTFKWGDEAPFPGYSTIAQRMGVTDKAARRHALSLEKKKYLKRRFRIGTTNEFDLTPLFDALLADVKRQQRAQRNRRQGNSRG